MRSRKNCVSASDHCYVFAVMKLKNSRSQFTIMDNTAFYLPTHSFSHILGSFEGVRHSRDNGYIYRKERPKECGIFDIISAGTNEAFRRGNSTHATVIGVVLIDSMKAGF